MVIVVSFFLIFTSWPWRWVVFHGWSASRQAKSMLSGSSETRDEFIDYVIYTAGDCVVFSEHNTEGRVMVYCPKDIPSDTTKIGSLTHLIGDWYTTRK